jgi:hypothetical protein
VTATAYYPGSLERGRRIVTLAGCSDLFAVLYCSLSVGQRRLCARTRSPLCGFFAIERARVDIRSLLHLPEKTMLGRRHQALGKAHRVRQGTGMNAHPRAYRSLPNLLRAPSFGFAIGAAIGTVPDRWRCAKTPPSLFTNAVNPDLPIESAISAGGLPSASSSSKGTQASFSPPVLWFFPPKGVNFPPRIKGPSKYGPSTA